MCGDLQRFSRGGRGKLQECPSSGAAGSPLSRPSYGVIRVGQLDGDCYEVGHIARIDVEASLCDCCCWVVLLCSLDIAVINRRLGGTKHRCSWQHAVHCLFICVSLILSLESNRIVF